MVGEVALQECSRRKLNHGNRVEEHLETTVVKIATELQAIGQVHVVNESEKRGITVSPGGVRSIWLRHDLHTFNK